MLGRSEDGKSAVIAYFIMGRSANSRNRVFTAKAVSYTHLDVYKRQLVKDAHDSARNIDPSVLPEEVQINRGWAGDVYSMMSGIDVYKRQLLKKWRWTSSPPTRPFWS